MMHAPLPPPTVSREALHRRRIECTGYRRADNLWDIEAELVDTRTFVSATGDRPVIAPGEPLHHFQLRITLGDDLVIRDAQARTLFGPAYTCPEITAAYEQLVGLKLASGFQSKVRALFAGISGCTHLTELLGPLATTAIQTIAPHLEKLERARRESLPPGVPLPRPVLLDSCHTYRSDGPAVKRKYPEAYTGT
jgi:hypothetical protein